MLDPGWLYGIILLPQVLRSLLLVVVAALAPAEADLAEVKIMVVMVMVGPVVQGEMQFAVLQLLVTLVQPVVVGTVLVVPIQWEVPEQG